MKAIRKTIGLLMVLALTVTLTVTAFAAGGGSITVENPKEGETYTAYRIFDVKYNEDKTAYSYTIAADSQWLAVVQGYAGVTLSDAVTDGDGNTIYIVTKNADFSAAAFAKTLQGAMEGKTGVELTAAGGKVAVTGLELGYYFVSSTNGALCNLTTTNPDATIFDKNDVPFEKTADDISVEVGQTVAFVITGKVPDTTGFDTYTFEISDTMSSGLTFNKDVQVYVDGTLLEDHYTLTNTPAEDGATGFTLSIDVMQLQDMTGKQVKVTYSAVVNENAVSVIQENDAKLKYSNDPTDSSKFTTIPDEVKLYTAKIVIDKFETGNEDKKLAGAQFVLMNGSSEFYAYDEATESVSWVAEQKNATVVTTDDLGSGAFIGLEDGTYTLKEIKAPAGYNLLTNTIEITVAGNDSDETALTVEAEVANNTGSQLPSTGGIGTTVFYILGVSMMSVSAVLFVIKKQRRTCA